MDDEVSPQTSSQDAPELALDLNFVPTWARQPPENPYAGREETGDRERRDDRPGRREGNRFPTGRREGHERRGPRPGNGPRTGDRGGFGERGHRPPGAGGQGSRMGGRDSRPFSDRDRNGPRREGERRDGEGRRPAREPVSRMNVRVSFLPDRERLSLVVRDIQVSRRAFPLIEIASRFLGRDDLYLVKLELPAPAEGQERKTFMQCLECKRVFCRRANAEAHLLNDHIDKFFMIEETEVEPPTGAFACVARCGLSGVLLGPPNYHGYNEKIQELWSSRFAHLSKAEYLGHVETVRDEALVEQWKDSLRKKTVYRLKEVPEGQTAEPMSRAEAQDWMRTKVNGMLRESGRCMLPGAQARKFDDPSLRAAVSLAWQKESRFPFTLSLALRPAFRHMHLHLFKVNAKETYVTAVAPAPVDLATAPAIVKEIVAFLEAHPGSTRQQVLEGLQPGADPESSEAAELLLHLGNLVANGGVIEFFNATLSLPRRNTKPEEESSENAPAEETNSPEAVLPGDAEPSEAPAETEPAPASAPGETLPAAEPGPGLDSALAADGAGTTTEEPVSREEPARPE